MYLPPETIAEETDSQQDMVFTSRNTIAEETYSLPQWGAMKFIDLLALQNALVIPIGGNQASNGGLQNSLHETAEEFHGLNHRVEIQRTGTRGYYKRFQKNDALPNNPSQDTLNKPAGEYGDVSDTDEIYKEEEEPDGVDLNKKIQQRPRRKKHRPKVVSEVRPKQRAQKSADANKTPRQQRKYSSRSKINIPLATPPQRKEVELACKIPDRRPFRSCRKTLKFDLEDQMEAAREYSTCDILQEFNTVKDYGEGKKTSNLTSISSKLEIGLKRVNSGSADSQANYLHLRSEIFSFIHKKRRTEKVVKTNTAYILSFTNALENIRAATGLNKCSREDRGIYFPDICKRRRTEKVMKVNMSHILSFTRALENIREAKGLRNNGKHAANHHDNRQAIKWGDINELNKRFRSPICCHDLDSQDGNRAHKRPSTSSAKGRVKGTQKKSMITLQASSMKAHHRKQNRKKSRKKKSVAVVNKQSLMLYDDPHFTKNPKGRFLSLTWINTKIANMDAIIEGMKQLSINTEGSIVQYQQTNALIPYRVRRHQTKDLTVYRGNTDVIPFEGAQSSKRLDRAKVDLDMETNRVWNLLLEDINNQGIDGIDEDKTKWWEEERNVSRGRVDSFIARMRLVQGDRRFSPWNGSVVDSVVGVFLTQNVSDHLSSSAYMSLAARYPLKPENEARKGSEKQIGTSVKEADIRIVELDNSSDDYALNKKTVEGHIFDKSLRASGDVDVVEEVVINTDVRDDTLAEICTHFNNHSEGAEVTNNLSFVELLQLAEKPVLHATSAPIDKVASWQSDREDIVARGEEMIFQSQRQPIKEQHDAINLLTEGSISPEVNLELPTVLSGELYATESTCATISTIQNKLAPTLPLSDHYCSTGEVDKVSKQDVLVQKKRKKPRKASYEWDNHRKKAQAKGSRQRTTNTMDSLDWEAIRGADVSEISNTIRERGMNNMLAERIKEFLDRLVNDHGSIDLEWIRDVPPDKAKEYLLSINGLGLKSVECVRLLTLHHLAFPVDTNVGRIAVRLGWVPLQPLPESLQLHLLELYPILESIQKYLWPRLCKLDQRTLYELHYHMITFGKVFCTKKQPNCNACPLRGECRHFASAFASARLALPRPQDKSVILFNQSDLKHQDPQVTINGLLMPPPMANLTLEATTEARNCEPIVEIPESPEQEPEEIQSLECNLEDAFCEDPNEIPTIKLNMEQFTQTLQAYVNSNKELQEGDMSKSLVALAAGSASIPIPKLKNVSRLRTEHHVYELPDTHYLLSALDEREPNDPCPYLLAIWSSGETANSTEPPEKRCSFEEPGQLCCDETCFFCNSQREANSQIVRGTLLIPCRTAMRGRFPLNGTYFQVNEVFADQDSSLNPIKVPRALLWDLPRRIVYFGTSIPTIFKGLSTEEIRQCFCRGYVCVRGFDQKTRAPRPLMARLHFPASRSRAGGRFQSKIR